MKPGASASKTALMKSSLPQTIILAAALVTSALLLSHGMASLGRGMEAAASGKREVNVHLPEAITLKASGPLIPSQVRLDLQLSSPGNAGLVINGLK